MDLRTYSIRIDPRIADVIEHLEAKSVTCDFSKLPLQRRWSYNNSDMPSWENSLIYESFFRFSCIDGEFRISSYVRMNQGLLVLTIVCCVLISRFFARSWIINLSVAALLLSRGRLIAANGFISGQGLMTCLMTLWMCGVFHWLRSGSRLLLVFIALLPFLLMAVDLSLTAIGFVLPLGLVLLYLLRPWYLPKIISQLRYQKKRGVHLNTDATTAENVWVQLRLWLREHIYTQPIVLPVSVYFAKGGLFRSIKVPFLLWLQHHRQWKPLILSLSALQLVQWGIVVWMTKETHFVASSFSWNSFSAWFQQFIRPIDLDLFVAFIFLFLTLLRRPNWGLTGFWEGTWFLLCSIGATAVGTYLWEVSSPYYLANLQLEVVRAAEILFWFEPILLSFALLSAFHFAKILSQKFIDFETT